MTLATDLIHRETTKALILTSTYKRYDMLLMMNSSFARQEAMSSRRYVSFTHVCNNLTALRDNADSDFVRTTFHAKDKPPAPLAIHCCTERQHV
jgi:hypothetical protein